MEPITGFVGIAAFGFLKEYFTNLAKDQAKSFVKDQVKSLWSDWKKDKDKNDVIQKSFVNGFKSSLKMIKKEWNCTNTDLIQRLDDSVFDKLADEEILKIYNPNQFSDDQALDLLLNEDTVQDFKQNKELFQTVTKEKILDKIEETINQMPGDENYISNLQIMGKELILSIETNLLKYISGFIRKEIKYDDSLFKVIVFDSIQEILRILKERKMSMPAPLRSMSNAFDKNMVVELLDKSFETNVGVRFDSISNKLDSFHKENMDAHQVTHSGMEELKEMVSELKSLFSKTNTKLQSNNASEFLKKIDLELLQSYQENLSAVVQQIKETIDEEQIVKLKRKLERLKNDCIELSDKIQNNNKTHAESSLEKFKSNLLELINENEYDEFFNILSNSKDIKYDKSVCNQFKAEFTQGQSKFDTNYAKRLRAFVNGLKKMN